VIVAHPQNADQLTAGMRPAAADFFKISSLTKGTGTYADFFLMFGYPGPLTVFPTLAGAQCNRNTIGAIPFENAPAGKECWLTGLQAMGALANSYALYDRLVHYGGGNGGSTAVQNLGPVPLPRYTNGEGVIAFIEFYNATGNTLSNLTVNYTDTTDVARQSIVTMPQTPVFAQIVPVQIAGGIRGIKSVQSIQLSNNTGVVGNFGITLLRRLTKFAVPAAGGGVNLDWLALGMPKIFDDACLSLMGISNTTVTGVLDLGLNFSDV
jgi:hypothetical protein